MPARIAPFRRGAPPAEPTVTTEWLRVMLDEIARKRDEAARAREELERRGQTAPKPAADAPRPARTTAA